MCIRKFLQSDKVKILDIYAQSKTDELKFEAKEFNLLPLEEDKKRFTLLNESDIYVYEDTEIVAYGAHFGLEIRALFVQPNARKKGIGVKLFKHLLSKITGEAFLFVVASNYPAIHLYNKYGFNITEELETSYNNKSVKVVKMVQSSHKNSSQKTTAKQGFKEKF